MTTQKVNIKRQITLPKKLYLDAGIVPGDRVGLFEYEGQITIIKKQSGASAGALAYLNSNPVVSDEESLLDAVQKK